MGHFFYTPKLAHPPRSDKSRHRSSLESFAQYFGNCASRARSFMKINSRRTPLVSCVLHQNLLRDRQHLREPAHCDVSGREPVSSQAHLQNLGRLLQIDRDSVIGHVCKYTPSTSHSDLRLTEFLLCEEPRLIHPLREGVNPSPTRLRPPPRLSSLSVAKDLDRRGGARPLPPRSEGS